MAEDVGDGQRRKVQRALSTDPLDTHPREQYDNGGRCGEAVLEIRTADLMEYRPLAFLPYRSVIDVIVVEGVKRLFVPRTILVFLRDCWRAWVYTGTVVTKNVMRRNAQRFMGWLQTSAGAHDGPLPPSRDF